MERCFVGDMMYRLRVETQFDAAHKMIGYEGKCSRLHGHTWKVEVFVVGEKLNEIGVLFDFNVIKEKLKEITEKLDHSFLNDFKEIGNPTCENIAKYIFENLKNLPNAKMEKVRVWESPKSYAEYFER